MYVIIYWEGHVKVRPVGVLAPFPTMSILEIVKLMLRKVWQPPEPLVWFLRQGLTAARLVQNSICYLGWPETFGNPPASACQVLGLQVQVFVCKMIQALRD